MVKILKETISKELRESVRMVLLKNINNETEIIKKNQVELLKFKSAITMS